MNSSTKAKVADESWSQTPSPVIGKDVLELLSSAMYVDPMTIYREYVQNAADAIEKAVHLAILPHPAAGSISIDFNTQQRSVCIRDNGTGIGRDEFADLLTTVGRSTKRGTVARGFRGVGRLAGLGYCQELFFRSRKKGEKRVNEMKWDCRGIRAAVRSDAQDSSLQDLISNVVSIRQIEGTEFPEHFFEVEMHGIVRLGNDSLINPNGVYDYLAEVAPVPFHPKFSFGDEINSKLANCVPSSILNIKISGIEEQVYRPYQDIVLNQGVEYDRFREIEIFSLPSVDESHGAIGWFAHHSYKGAIPDSRLRGLRLRSGNLQIGGNQLLQDLFGEPRFNAWAVGEIHVIDRRMVPNGRRDHFEKNIHFDNLVNQLAPLARQIGSKCRESSRLRNFKRNFEAQVSRIKEKTEAILQGSLSFRFQNNLLRESDNILFRLSESLSSDLVVPELRAELQSVLDKLATNLNLIRDVHQEANELRNIPKVKRETMEMIFGLIYECSTEKSKAKKLIDDIIRQLSLQNAESLRSNE
jgi:hypothetical protein